MSKKVDRESLLNQLESVTPGLSTKEIVEQSSCFVFMDGKVVTFNDEIACSMKCDLRIKGAIQSRPLLDLLRRLPEDHLQVSVESGKLSLQGKRKVAKLVLDTEITLPFTESIREPKTWTPLHENFLEAVNLVYRCAGRDDDKLEVYVHIAPDRIEALAAHQVGRYSITTGVSKSILVHKDSIKHVSALGMIEFGQTKGWTHFRNPQGLTLSCRTTSGDEEFPDISKHIDMKGSKITLPKGLVEATERAAVITVDNLEDDDILILITQNKLVVKGTGVCGSYREAKTIDYAGKDLQFMVSPRLLADITAKHNSAWIEPTRLKVKAGKFTYVTALGTIEKGDDVE